MYPVFYLIEGYFILGIIITAIPNKKNTPTDTRSRWLKLFVHLFIVNFLILYIIYFSYLLGFLALVILSLCAFEMFASAKQNKQSKKFYIKSAIIFALCGMAFFTMLTIYKPSRIVFIFLVVFIFDGFAQLTGQNIGRRKLFPETSPNKSIEGLAGGALVSIITAVAIGNWIKISIFQSVVLAIIIIIAAVLGDWLASYYKRRHAIKDFSNLIPGHGGVLDRFDSWIVAGAIIYFIHWLWLFNYYYVMII